jgi:hypothetical protein
MVCLKKASRIISHEKKQKYQWLVDYASRDYHYLTSSGEMKLIIF